MKRTLFILMIIVLPLCLFAKGKKKSNDTEHTSATSKVENPANNGANNSETKTYSPIDISDYIKIAIKQPYKSGSSTRDKISNYSTLHYIGIGDGLFLLFDDIPLEQLPKIKLKITATLITIKGEEIPLNVLGFTTVEKKTETTGTNKKFPDALEYKYNLTYNEIEGSKLSNTEIDLTTVQINAGDHIKLYITNVLDQTGFITVFDVEDYGWKNGPSSGFAWLKTSANNDINFQPAPWLGYSFYYKHSKSASFVQQLLIPSFGAEASVLQLNSNVYVGVGGQVSILFNTVKFSYGKLFNYPGNGEYFTIGLNFINSVQSLTSLIKKE